MLLATFVLAFGIALWGVAALIVLVAPDLSQQRVKEVVMFFFLIGLLCMTASIQSFII
jgi:hypothetical protein